MSRPLKDIMNDITKDAAVARREAEQRGAAEQRARDEAENVKKAQLAVFNEAFASTTSILSGIRREFSALNIQATVISDRRNVVVDGGQYVDFGSLVFQVPSTIGKMERWAAVRFLFAGNISTGVGSVHLFAGGNAGAHGSEGLTRHGAVNLTSKFPREDWERLALDALDKVRG
ncbi:hypothetical protein WMF27_38640 [Sorangium sp. So ce281]|uniref:hypothetical protein n=1 Tax=unclassified Sorangium TaxID=2621164 RepID=UPI003F613B35